MIQAHQGNGEKKLLLLVNSDASVNILKPIKSVEQIQLIGFSGDSPDATVMGTYSIQIEPLKTKTSV